jgi:two-component system, OmpR family, KDP operon response regulator KdpE
MKRGRVLVVDDEEQIRRAVGRALTARDFTVETSADGETALASARIFQPDLIVLDLNLPGMDGMDVTRELRTWTAVPILILSVREDESDKVAALDLGADDYLTKPFGIDELMARVRALLRRAAAKSGPRPRHFRTATVEIDLDAHLVTREGDKVHLTRTEWSLLETLSEHPGKLLTHRWLLERVWGAGYAEDVDVLRVFVSQLRRKIEADPSRPAIVATDPGIGYRWLLRAADDQEPDRGD